MTSVLFVCLGNICRSPAGEEILRQFGKKANLENLEVASCGLGDWHVGELPHAVMRRTAEKRGFQLNNHAQQFQPTFLDAYDWILAADHEVYRDLMRHASPEQQKKIVWMTEHSRHYPQQEVPDPYGLENTSFEKVLDILEDACQGWITFLKKYTT